MTQEEKAKRYDEAFNSAKEWYNNPNSSNIGKSYLYAVFPELKESEDEKIRKAIHIYFDWLDGRKDYQPKGEYTIRDMIAWLEKQGEQKPNPYSGTSFEYNGHTWGMCARDNGVDILLDRQFIKHLEKQGEQKQDPCDNCKDVMLNCHNFPCVKKRAFKEGKSVLEVIKEDDEKITYSETDGYKLVGPKFHEGEWVVNKFGDVWHIDSFDGKNYQVSDGKGNYNYFPISRQDKMHHWTIQDAKAGDVLVYKENIKGSNGIKYERICLFNNFDNAFFILTTISNDVEGYDIDVNINYPDDTIPATKEQRDTLEKAMAGVGYTFDFKYKESLKTRQNSAWSEEDEKSLDALITSLNNERFYRHLKTLKSIDVNVVIDWLKSLKDRVGCEANCTTTKEWSKEDEKKRNLLIDILNVNHPNGCFKVNPANTSNMEAMHTEELVSWLKSLRPQSTWKPSEEQIKVLDEVIKNPHLSSTEYNTLTEIEEQLRKLK